MQVKTHSGKVLVVQNNKIYFGDADTKCQPLDLELINGTIKRFVIEPEYMIFLTSHGILYYKRISDSNTKKIMEYVDDMFVTKRGILLLRGEKIHQLYFENTNFVIDIPTEYTKNIDPILYPFQLDVQDYKFSDDMLILKIKDQGEMHFLIILAKGGVRQIKSSLDLSVHDFYRCDNGLYAIHEQSIYSTAGNILHSKRDLATINREPNPGFSRWYLEAGTIYGTSNHTIESRVKHLIAYIKHVHRYHYVIDDVNQSRCQSIHGYGYFNAHGFGLPSIYDFEKDKFYHIYNRIVIYYENNNWYTYCAGDCNPVKVEGPKPEQIIVDNNSINVIVVSQNSVYVFTNKQFVELRIINELFVDESLIKYDTKFKTIEIKNSIKCAAHLILLNDSISGNFNIMVLDDKNADATSDFISRLITEMHEFMNNTYDEDIVNSQRTTLGKIIAIILSTTKKPLPFRLPDGIVLAIYDKTCDEEEWRVYKKSNIPTQFDLLSDSDRALIETIKTLGLDPVVEKETIDKVLSKARHVETSKPVPTESDKMIAQGFRSYYPCDGMNLVTLDCFLYGKSNQS